MKYIVFWEFCPEDMDKVVAKFQEYQKDHSANPGKYQEYLYPPHSISETMKGFSVVEATPEQIINVVSFWNPILRLTYKPIIPSAQFVEQYVKFK